MIVLFHKFAPFHTAQRCPFVIRILDELGDLVFRGRAPGVPPVVGGGVVYRLKGDQVVGIIADSFVFVVAVLV